MIKDVTAATVKDRLARGNPSIGAWMTVNSPEMAEVMACCGFDWLAVDLEHSAIGLPEAVSAFTFAERRGVVPLARLPSADPYLARRLLDSGAQGLIVPVVEDPAVFRAFLDHLFYPPKGRRGVGLSRANAYGLKFDSYLGNFAPLIVPQIETAAGVAASPALAAMDEVDALFLGPYDLSATLGVPGEFGAASFVEALATVRHACDENGVAAGIHQVKPATEELRARIVDGFRFIAYGTDAQAVRYAFADLPDLKGSVDMR